jgi:hypothetical protein
LFRSGLVLKAHRLLCHSTLGSRVMKKRKTWVEEEEEAVDLPRARRVMHYIYTYINFSKKYI